MISLRNIGVIFVPRIQPPGVESTFATVRLRHKKTKGNGSRRACLAMVFKLCQSAQKRWRRLNGHALIQDVIAGVTFTDGEKQQAA